MSLAASTATATVEANIQCRETRDTVWRRFYFHVSNELEYYMNRTVIENYKGQLSCVFPTPLGLLGIFFISIFFGKYKVPV